jgi:hypothetical protein
MQFIVIGHDGNDEGAPARRQAAREEHLKLGRELHAAGKWLYAAALLDDAGAMNGSLIVCDFPSREALQREWLDREAYVSGGVWLTIEVRRAAVAPFCAGK